LIIFSAINHGINIDIFENAPLKELRKKTLLDQCK